MTKCSKCKRRKAKRFCIGVRGHLCSLCCGILRDKEIHCPPSCKYLVQHQPYQEKRIIEKKSASYSKKLFSKEDILNNERMSWLAYHIEIPLREWGEKRESFMDRNAILALEYAQKKN